MTTKQLSPAMEKALTTLTDKWQSAYELQTSHFTLDALVRRGLAEYRFWEYRKAQTDD